MYKNYLKIAWRNLTKKKGYTFINISGLAVGMACCMIIFLFVYDELSYDGYHEHGDRIYQVIHGSESAADSEFWVWNNAPIGPAMANEFPEIEKVVQFSGKADILLRHGEITHQEDGVFFMDSTVFDVFSWNFIDGDPKTALVAPYSIVLTESAAKKYFGNEEALGKILEGRAVAGRAEGGDYTVTGIIEDIPSNSHFRFNALLSLSTFHNSIPQVFDMWGYADFYTYIKVNEQFNREDFERKIPDFMSRVTTEDNAKYTIRLVPLEEVYLKSEAQQQPGELGSLSNIYIFSIIGLFIIVIAIINFINLSTARSMERAKEVGIRKSIGADRKRLIFQFMGESVIIVFLSLLAAIIIFSVAATGLTDLTGKLFAIEDIISWQSLPILLLTFLAIAFLAGLYPAFVLSSFKPVSILKGINKSDGKGVGLKKALVVFQFSLSIALIAGTLIVYYQMNYLQNKDLGFDKEKMLVLDYNYDGRVNEKMEVLKTQLEANPSISSVAFSRSVPGSHFPNAETYIEDKDGEMLRDVQPIFQVGVDFIPHYGVELVAGRTYSRDIPTDMDGALVINEATARQYGYSDPEEIIGKRFEQWGKGGEIIGVVKDFNYISLHRNIEPLTLPWEPEASRYLSIKIRTNDLPQTISEVENVWKEIAPHRPFLYSFLDDDFDRQYQTDIRFRKIFTLFSVLAIIIACLGLFGLATYTAEIRTKEIGIRKVLGAETSGIVTLLSKDFIKLVFIAIVIASPLSWYAMNRWLEGFAYQIEISWWIFPLAGVIAIFIAILTVSTQAMKAALMNPVKALRSE